MKLINSRDFHKNPGKHLAYLNRNSENDRNLDENRINATDESGLEETDTLTIIMRRNRPICVLSSITEEEFCHIKLQEDINQALREIQNGEKLSHEEITQKFLGRQMGLTYTRYKIIYAVRVVNDLNLASAKSRTRILKKLYEKCHFREPFDSYVENSSRKDTGCVYDYSEIKAGKYTIVCLKDEANIHVLCIYPPYGSCKEKFRL
ncbi:MAG: hypothetical protein Q8P68_02950 [Candidatus Peregrinibacteria bacterium]|nr:hypothetical protein [Candidatus Peregrinibacteria bacterium]